jgi:hypothetical protein
MKLVDYLSLLDDSERRLADAFTLLATRHAADGDIRDTAINLAKWSTEKRAALAPMLDAYGRTRTHDADRLHDALFKPRLGGFGLLRDVHDASLLVHHVHLCWTAVEQAAKALIDRRLTELCKRELARTERQARWLRTAFKVTAPQALTIVPDKRSELRATLQGMKPRLVAAASMLAVAVIGVAGVAWLRRH